MSRLGMIGQISLASANLSNDALKEGVELLNLFGGNSGPAWIAHMKKVRTGGLPYGPIRPRQTLLNVIATTEQEAIGEDLTARFFPRYEHRDEDFDNWLPTTQPASDACSIMTVNVTREFIFLDAARALPTVEQTWDMAALGRSLIANGYTMTLAQADDMIERARRGECTGIRIDGEINFFFVETGDQNNPVLVGHVDHDDPSWYASLDMLDYDNRWPEGTRLLVRNLDVSKL